MADIFGYDFKEAQEQAEAPKSLTAVTYKLLITSVDIGNHPYGGDFTPITNHQWVQI